MYNRITSKLLEFILLRLDAVKAFLFRMAGTMETERLINSVSVFIYLVKMIL